MKVSIIILNYNTPNLVYDCLDSIQKNLETLYEVIVVDNGSTEKVSEERIKAFKCTRVYFLEKNLGFGSGNNFGAKQAAGDVLWFLNSDTIIPNKIINKIFELVASNKELGIVSPLLYNDHACQEFQKDMFAKFQTLKGLLLRHKPKMDFEKELVETDLVVGASMVIRKELFDKVGGFDEKIFLFFEDDDLCFRVKKLGKKIVIYTKARIIHLQGKSIKRNTTRKKFYYISQNYFWQKHYGFWPTLIMRIIRFPLKLKNTL